MTDYDKATGSAGTLRIRDDGSVVQFWILCSNGATNVASLGWTGTINGGNVGGSVALPAGFGSKLVASYAVSTTQDVAFNIAASGTSGLGGPTNHSAHITRGPAAGVPATPTAPTFTNIARTSVRVLSGQPADNGAAIDKYFFRWSLSSSLSPALGEAENAGYIYDITGLKAGTLYYVATGAHNAAGWSPLSPIASVRTAAGVYVSNGTAWTSSELYVDNGTTAKLAEVLISDGTTWKPAG